MSIRLAFAVAAAVSALPAAAQKVDLGAPLPRFSLIKEGVHRYVVYRKTGDASVPLGMEAHEVRFEQKDGTTELHIRHRTDWTNPPRVATVDAWFAPSTFQPLSEIRTTDNAGTRTVEGFVFAPDKITGMRDLAGNTQKEFAMSASEPAFNFEMDNELMQALPLAEGYAPNINFYHPGATQPPQRYTWKFVGSETISGPSGPVDCWVLMTDYNTTKWPPRKFWFAKSSQLLVRHEMTGKAGTTVMALVE